MPVAIRPARAGDADAVAAIAQEVHAIHVAALPHIFQPATATVATPADMARLAAQPGQLLLVAVDADTVVGYAHAEAQATPDTSYKRAAARLHVHAMAVTAAHRGRGVGQALLAAVRAEAAVRGMDGVSLEVYAFNDAARAFYEREGFVVERARMVCDA
ncbi:MAG: N-acetyltransferase family protein [Gemmatirosa sp.]